MDRIPVDVLSVLLSNINFDDLFPVRLVSKTFLRASSSDAFWRLFLEKLEVKFFSLFRGNLRRFVEEKFRVNQIEESVRQCDIIVHMMLSVHRLCRAFQIDFEVLVPHARIQCDFILGRMTKNSVKMSTIGVRRGFIRKDLQCTTMTKCDAVACICLAFDQPFVSSYAARMFYEDESKVYWIYDGDSFKTECIVDRNVDQNDSARAWRSLLKDDQGRPERACAFGNAEVTGLYERIAYPRGVLARLGVPEKVIDSIENDGTDLLDPDNLRIQGRIGGYPIMDPQGIEKKRGE